MDVFTRASETKRVIVSAFARTETFHVCVCVRECASACIFAFLVVYLYNEYSAQSKYVIVFIFFFFLLTMDLFRIQVIKWCVQVENEPKKKKEICSEKFEMLICSRRNSSTVCDVGQDLLPKWRKKMMLIYGAKINCSNWNSLRVYIYF